jgi:hypothetical protein
MEQRRSYNAHSIISQEISGFYGKGVLIAVLTTRQQSLEPNESNPHTIHNISKIHYYTITVSLIPEMLR